MTLREAVDLTRKAWDLGELDAPTREQRAELERVRDQLFALTERERSVAAVEAERIAGHTEAADELARLRPYSGLFGLEIEDPGQPLRDQLEACGARSYDRQRGTWHIPDTITDEQGEQLYRLMPELRVREISVV